MSFRLALALVGTLLLAAPVLGVALAKRGSGAGGSAARAPREAGCSIFPASNPINQDISHAPVDPNSARYIEAIGPGYLHASFSSERGYGFPFSIVGPHQPMVPMRFTLSPRSSEPGPYPIPLDAPIQGEGNPGDTHVLVLQTGTCQLYELYKANRSGGGWEAGAGAVFNLRSNKLRPEGWGSADEAGLPILPLLARYPEVRAGAIKHALRVAVRSAQNAYIHPATHVGEGGTNPGLPPMGLRLRLKASFSLAPYHGEALIVLRALKRYGLMVADEGGSWNIGGTHDPGWSDRDLKQLETVPGSAFEAVRTGPVLHPPSGRRRYRRG